MFFITNWRLPYFEDASNMLVDVTFDWKRGWAIVNQKNKKNKKIAFTAIRKRNSWISKTERKKCKDTQNLLLDGYYLLLDYLVPAKKKIGSYPETVPRNRPELSTWNWIFCMNIKTVNSAFLWCEDQNYADLRGSISRLDLQNSSHHTYKSHSIILFLLIIPYLNFPNNFICNKQ